MLLSHKRKDEISPFATTWKAVESIVLSEMSHKVKDKNGMFSPICGTQNKKQQVNKQNKLKDTTEWWTPEGKGVKSQGDGRRGDETSGGEHATE